MAWDEVVYKCKQCTEEQKIQRGCISPTTDPIAWKITPCYACNGEDELCSHCQGSNRVAMYRCPRALAKSPLVNRLLPFVYHYRKHGLFPNGGPILKQPKPFLIAVNTYDYYLSVYEGNHYKRLNKKDGK